MILGSDDDEYFFLNKANKIIIDDKDFTVEDVWKNDEDGGGYRIDLVTEKYFNEESKLVNLYINDVKYSAIKCKENMNLKKIKNWEELIKILCFF